MYSVEVLSGFRDILSYKPEFLDSNHQIVGMPHNRSVLRAWRKVLELGIQSQTDLRLEYQIPDFIAV